MNRFLKPIQAVFLLAVIVALTGCTLGQAAEPTATAIDVNAVMTSAASAAYAQLTEIAAQATPTLAPTETQAPTNIPEITNTPGQEPAAPTLTVAPLSVASETPAVVTEAVATAADAGIVATIAPSLTPVPAYATNTGPLCKKPTFIEDVTITDGTVLKPGQKFQKIWRIQNSGTCAWDQGFGIVLWAGPAMGGSNNFFSGGESVKAGGIVDMVVDMRAPWEPGEYIAHWVMLDDVGKPFGTDLVVYIKVVK